MKMFGGETAGRGEADIRLFQNFGRWIPLGHSRVSARRKEIFKNDSVLDDDLNSGCHTLAFFKGAGFSFRGEENFDV